MSFVHLHLVLNHVPMIGLVFVVLILGVALWQNKSETAKLGLAFTVGIAAVAALVFLTGEPAEEAVEGIAGVTERAIHAHEEAAEGALIATLLAGVVSLFMLGVFRRRALPRRMMQAALAVTLVAGGVMGWTANLGGQIRHTEIGASAAAAGGSDDDDR